jgi:TRAP-type C4-dicarboxylate transport system permease small subunit
MSRLVPRFYQLLLAGACLSMLAAFVSIALGILARLLAWDIPGLDAYAGYSIAAALFLALPDAFRNGDHIRVTLLLQKLPERGRTVLEAWCLASGLALSLAMAWYACRLVWVSYATHDVSPASDVTPLWIPQLSMALGCIGFAVAFADAALARLNAREFFRAPPAEMARAE